MNTLNQYTSLCDELDVLFEQIEKEWKRADDEMWIWKNKAGMGSETGAFQTIARDERKAVRHLIATFCDKVVYRLLPFVDVALRLELTTFTDELDEGINSPTGEWQEHYRKKYSRLTQVLKTSQPIVSDIDHKGKEPRAKPNKTDWRDVQRRLLAMYDRSKAFTTTQQCEASETCSESG